MAEPLDFSDPLGAQALARVRRGLSDAQGAIVDGLDPDQRRYVLWSIEHARLVSSAADLRIATGVHASHWSGLPTEAFEMVNAAYGRASERLMRAGPVKVRA